MNTLDQIKSVLAHEGDATVIAPAFRQHLLDLIASAPRHAMHITHLGREYRVLAAFPDTPEGTAAANRHMTENPGAAVLCTRHGVTFLAHREDPGAPAEQTVHMRAACHTAQFLTGDLRTVLKTASAVEALVLLPLIERAATLAREVDALRAAMAATE